MHWTWIALCLTILAGSGHSARSRKMKYCSLNNYIACYAEPIARFTQQINGTGVATNDQEYEEYCHAMADVSTYCAQKFTERCASPFFKELLYYLHVNQMKESNLEYCKKGNNSIREKFLRNSKCINEQVKLTTDYRNTCIRDLLQELEEAHDLGATKGWTGSTGKTCCALNRWMACIQTMIGDSCGEEAKEVFPNLLKSLDPFVFRMCRQLPQFVPSNKENECGDLIRSDQDPKGYTSNSLFSYVFSSFCTNVAYGIH